jgi:hypothetical protein
MVTTAQLKEKSTAIMNHANTIGISKLYIAENYGGDQSSEEEYISPSSIIFETASEGLKVTKDNFNSFKQFLISELSDTGISLLSQSATKYNVLSKNILSERSKHLLDTAIDITQIRTDQSWKVQFEEQKNKKKGAEVALETELAEQNQNTLSTSTATSPLSNQPRRTEANPEDEVLEKEKKRQKLEDQLSSPLFQFVLGILDEKQKSQIGQEYPEIADKLSSPRSANQSSSSSEGTPNSSPQKPVIHGTGLEVS